jgi:hypothetical protein
VTYPLGASLRGPENANEKAGAERSGPVPRSSIDDPRLADLSHSRRLRFPPVMHHGCRLVRLEVGLAGLEAACVREIERQPGRNARI